MLDTKLVGNLYKVAALASTLKQFLPTIDRYDIGLGLGGLVIGGGIGNHVFQSRLPHPINLEQNQILPVKTLPRLNPREQIYGNLPNSQSIYPTTGASSG